MSGSRVWAVAKQRVTPAWLGGNRWVRESSGDPPLSRSVSRVEETWFLPVGSQARQRTLAFPASIPGGEDIGFSLTDTPVEASLQLPPTDPARKRDFKPPLGLGMGRREEPEAFRKGLWTELPIIFQAREVTLGF